MLSTAASFASAAAAIPSPVGTSTRSASNKKRNRRTTFRRSRRVSLGDGSSSSAQNRRHRLLKGENATIQSPPSSKSGKETKGNKDPNDTTDEDNGFYVVVEGGNATDTSLKAETDDDDGTDDDKDLDDYLPGLDDDANSVIDTSASAPTLSPTKNPSKKPITTFAPTMKAEEIENVHKEATHDSTVITDINTEEDAVSTDDDDDDDTTNRNDFNKNDSSLETVVVSPLLSLLLETSSSADGLLELDSVAIMENIIGVYVESLLLTSSSSNSRRDTVWENREISSLDMRLTSQDTWGMGGEERRLVRTRQQQYGGGILVTFAGVVSYYDILAVATAAAASRTSQGNGDNKNKNNENNGRNLVQDEASQELSYIVQSQIQDSDILNLLKSSSHEPLHRIQTVYLYQSSGNAGEVGSGQGQGGGTEPVEVYLGGETIDRLNGQENSATEANGAAVNGNGKSKLNLNLTDYLGIITAAVVAVCVLFALSVLMREQALPSISSKKRRGNSVSSYEDDLTCNTSSRNSKSLVVSSRRGGKRRRMRRNGNGNASTSSSVGTRSRNSSNRSTASTINEYETLSSPSPEKQSPLHDVVIPIENFNDDYSQSINSNRGGYEITPGNNLTLSLLLQEQERQQQNCDSQNRKKTKIGPNGRPIRKRKKKVKNKNILSFRRSQPNINHSCGGSSIGGSTITDGPLGTISESSVDSDDGDPLDSNDGNANNSISKKKKKMNALENANNSDVVMKSLVIHGYTSQGDEEAESDHGVACQSSKSTHSCSGDKRVEDEGFEIHLDHDKSQQLMKQQQPAQKQSSFRSQFKRSGSGLWNPKFPRSLSFTRRNNSNEVESEDVTKQHFPEESNQHQNSQMISIPLPTGKIGLLIDIPTPDNPCIVHHVKETSPIYQTLKPGDELHYLNQTDLRDMTPFQISKLLSKKIKSVQGHQQLKRNLVVKRFFVNQNSDFFNTSNDYDHQEELDTDITVYSATSRNTASRGGPQLQKREPQPTDPANVFQFPNDILENVVCGSSKNKIVADSPPVITIKNSYSGREPSLPPSPRRLTDAFCVGGTGNVESSPPPSHPTILKSYSSERNDIQNTATNPPIKRTGSNCSKNHHRHQSDDSDGLGNIMLSAKQSLLKRHTSMRSSVGGGSIMSSPSRDENGVIIDQGNSEKQQQPRRTISNISKRRRANKRTTTNMQDNPQQPQSFSSPHMQQQEWNIHDPNSAAPIITPMEAYYIHKPVRDPNNADQMTVFSNITEDDGIHHFGGYHNNKKQQQLQEYQSPLDVSSESDLSNEVVLVGGLD